MPIASLNRTARIQARGAELNVREPAIARSTGFDHLCVH